MSLKLRLLVTMVALVVVTSVVLSAMHLNTVTATWLAHVSERSNSTAQFVKRWVLHRIEQGAPLPPNASIDEIRSRYLDSLTSDDAFPIMLAGLLADTRSIVEISVADEHSNIVASTNRARVGARMPTRLTLRNLIDIGPLDRMLAILGGRIDYESRVNLGLLSQPVPPPVFRIQVLVSSVLLREALVPVIGSTALASIAAVLIASVLAYFVARISLRPIARLGDAIDLIASGQLVYQNHVSSASEFQVVEQKLRLLGEQFRGAREGATQLRGSMERRLAAINRLTGGVAHEIKNPLNSIALRLELLKNRVLPEMPEATEEIAVIAEEINRLDRVVRTFLDFTRPVEIETAEIDLGALVDETVSVLIPEASAADIEVRWKNPARKVVVRGDVGLLKLAVWNVCRNALDAMPDGGILELKVTRDANDATVTVSDTGPGVALEQRERIFQLYYSTKPQGSGIGLAMAFRAVQLHGGSIEIGGQPGEGAEFTLRLPAA
jgi:signal transduction histidine kinase